MGYYCTVPQCTSLAGKTKNVKFHRFPRDKCMANRWNLILKRGKPVTKYSKVCSLHFTQADYNVTAMGHWKTLSKDAMPSQNLPVLNPDGSVMVIRKSRTVKYKEGKKDDCVSEKPATTNGQVMPTTGVQESNVSNTQNSILLYRLQTQTAAPAPTNKTVTDRQTTKQDAIMQTDPVPDDEDNQGSYVEMPIDYQHSKFPKDYTKSADFLPQTNDEYNKEAEKYALERKSHTLENTIYEKVDNYPKSLYAYEKDYPRAEPFTYPSGYETAEAVRQQHSNLQAMHENRVPDGYFEGQIKEELDDEKYGGFKKDDGSTTYEERLLQQHSLINPVKQEPDIGNGCDSVMQPQSSPYYQNDNQNNIAGTYYEQRPGPELLIAKQNALAAHTQLWQNTMKRPFFYTENNHYSGAQLLHRYEDLSRILQ